MTDDDVATVRAIDAAAPDPTGWSERSFREEVARGDRRCLVAEEDGEVIAFATARLGPDEGELLNVAVAPDHRRRGVATQLLEHLFGDLAAEGSAKVTLEVRAGNRAARDLYRRFGFRPVGRRPGYYPDGEDAVLMGAALQPDGTISSGPAPGDPHLDGLASDGVSDPGRVD